ncbi:MAG TPA: 3-deoxy-D-manno-octulosonic acid kinase [Salinisphaera sp.]|nr:3-deoxy-D-manno-octulosonic acid kinase [Salinisphaera sp.]
MSDSPSSSGDTSGDIAAPMIRARDGRVVIWQPAFFDTAAPEREHFDPAYWRSRRALVSEATGRGAAYFLRAGANQDWVLRHYRRGGILAHLNRDHYFWTGALRTRPLREFRLLDVLHRRGLKVPRPIAAQAVRRRGAWYRADLIIEAIPDTETLADRLTRQALCTADWRRLGRAIAALHDAGVWHADLNARNILVADSGRAFHIIDFDRARFRPAGRWRQANLARLRRSLDKFASQQPEFRLVEQDWSALTGGYRSALAVTARA